MQQATGNKHQKTASKQATSQDETRTPTNSARATDTKKTCGPDPPRMCVWGLTNGVRTFGGISYYLVFGVPANRGEYAHKAAPPLVRTDAGNRQNGRKFQHRGR